MKNPSLMKNYIYSMLYQILVTGLPFFVMPYLARILGPELLGVNGYANSVSQIFFVVALFGVSAYGSREIAYIRDNQDELIKTFWGLMYIKFLTTIVSLVFYLYFVFNFSTEYRIIMLFYSINILTVALDCSWFLTGIEDFKKLIIRNATVRVSSVLLIFIFVTNHEDFYTYVLINILTNLIANIIIWFQILRYINFKFVKFNFNLIKPHLGPMFTLFLPHLLIQFYAQLDRFILEKMSTIHQVGLYDQAQKLVVTLLAFTTNLSTVLSPRIANHFSNNDQQEVKYYINKSLTICAYFGLPLSVGLIAISNTFPVWFFGGGFKSINVVISLIAPMLFFTTLGTILGSQYLIQVKKQGLYTIAIIGGVVISVIFNILFDKEFGASGAALAKVLTEGVVAFLFFIFSYKVVNLKSFFGKFFKYGLVSLLMLVIVYKVGDFLGPNIFSTSIQVIIGIIIYMGVLYIIKDETNSIPFNKIREKILKKEVKI